MKLNKLTLVEAMEGLRRKDFTSTQLVKDCLSEIARLDTGVKSYIKVFEQEALRQAEDADTKIAQDERVFEKQPLLGIPYSCKDNYCTKGYETTAGSAILKGFVPPYESTVTQKLKYAGAIMLGKVNLDAFAHGASTDASDFFTTRNPWDLERVPGGSSGGSAASVAAHLCIFSIGSDTGGSIRCPASWCGVTGLKPTYGRVSRYGLIAMASSTDSPGPLSKTAEDAEIILRVIAGFDPKDATSSQHALRADHRISQDGFKNITVGVPKSYFDINFESEGIRQRVLEGIDYFKNQGAKIVEVDLLHPKYSIAVYTVIQRSEVSSNLARFDGVRFGHDREKFNYENKRRMMSGAYTLSAGYYDEYYAKAQKVRTIIIDEFKRSFEKVDIIIGPTMPNYPVKVGMLDTSPIFGELTDMMQIPGSMAGLAVVSVPCGFSDGFPVGMQIIGPQFSESLILQTAARYQRETEFHKFYPEPLKELNVV